MSSDARCTLDHLEERSASKLVQSAYQANTKPNASRDMRRLQSRFSARNSRMAVFHQLCSPKAGGSQKVSLLSALCVRSGSGRCNGYGRYIRVARSREPLVARSLTAGSRRRVIRRVPCIWPRCNSRTGRHRRTGTVILRRCLGLSRRTSVRKQQGCGRQYESRLCHGVSLLVTPRASHLPETNRREARRFQAS
jgi:hypothetical protein